MRRALLAAALLAAPCAAEEIKIGMAVPSYAHGVLWIAQDAGFFKKNGLDARIMVVQGSADAMRLLIAGKLDVALAGGDSLVKADLAGADLVAFAGVVNRFYHRIVTRAEITDPSGLKGRSIGLPRPRGVGDEGMIALARAAQRCRGTGGERK